MAKFDINNVPGIVILKEGDKLPFVLTNQNIDRYAEIVLKDKKESA